MGFIYISNCFIKQGIMPFALHKKQGFGVASSGGDILTLLRSVANSTPESTQKLSSLNSIWFTCHERSSSSKVSRTFLTCKDWFKEINLQVCWHENLVCEEVPVIHSLTIPAHPPGTHRVYTSKTMLLWRIIKLH